LLSGKIENLLYELVMVQKNLALQQNLSGPASGYLFVSPIYPRLVSISEFNEFLQKVISDNSIFSEDGSLARVTSHDLRHIGIVDRLTSGIFYAHEVQAEANHATLSQTMAYGYSSPHDEAVHVGEILKEVQDTSLWKFQTDATPRAVSPRKFSALYNQVFTRILPARGICCDVTCVPRYEQCVKCPSFRPNPIYREYFIDASHIYESRISDLEQKSGQIEAIEFNKKMLGICLSFLSKLETE